MIEASITFKFDEFSITDDSNYSIENLDDEKLLALCEEFIKSLYTKANRKKMPRVSFDKQNHE